jgi:hypothetical protein
MRKKAGQKPGEPPFVNAAVTASPQFYGLGPKQALYKTSEYKQEQNRSPRKKEKK